jgi:hypothetical protein
MLMVGDLEGSDLSGSILLGVMKYSREFIHDSCMVIVPADVGRATIATSLLDFSFFRPSGDGSSQPPGYHAIKEAPMP